MQLREQLRSGKTLAEVAEARGTSVDGLKKALTDAATKHIAAAVRAGRLTAAQQKEILAGLPSRIDQQVNGAFRSHGAGGRPGDGGPIPMPPGDDAPPTTPDGDTTAAAAA